MSSAEQKQISVLFVEDEPFLRELISRKLVIEKFRVKEAEDGELAVKLLESESPDIILLDLVLPGLNGFEVLTKIRQNQKTAKTPVIILSNLSQKADIQKGMSLGANRFLIKSNITPAEVVAAIRETLKTATAGTEIPNAGKSS